MTSLANDNNTNNNANDDNNKHVIIAGKTTTTTTRPNSDVANLQSNNQFISEALVKSTGSKHGRRSVHVINRIKRSSSENQRLLRRTNTAPNPILTKHNNKRSNNNNLNNYKKNPLLQFMPEFSMSMKRKSGNESSRNKTVENHNQQEEERSMSRIHRCASEIPTRRVQKNTYNNSKKYHQSFISKKKLKNEQLRVKIGRAISTAIETAEEEYHNNIQSNNTSSRKSIVGKKDEWNKEISPENNNNIISSTVRNLRNFFSGSNKKKKSTLLVNYAPKLFHAIRSYQGIRTSSYVFSMCNKPLKPKVFGASASGSFFFETSDKRYVLKTINKRECDQLRNMLFEYWKHLEKYSDTLLPRFMGMYKVKHTDNGFVRVLVMRNVFYTKLPISEKYDLKGSTVGRETKDGGSNNNKRGGGIRIRNRKSQIYSNEGNVEDDNDVSDMLDFITATRGGGGGGDDDDTNNDHCNDNRSSDGLTHIGNAVDRVYLNDGIGNIRKIKSMQKQKQKIATHTLKDMDLNKFIVIPVKYRNRLLDQCEKDVEFLMKHTIMDYSLLLGIYTHDTDITYDGDDKEIEKSKKSDMKLSVSKILTKTSTDEDTKNLPISKLGDSLSIDSEVIGHHRRPSFTSSSNNNRGRRRNSSKEFNMEKMNNGNKNPSASPKEGLAILKCKLLGELDDMIQHALVRTGARISSFSTADHRMLSPRLSKTESVGIGKKKEQLSYTAVKQKLIKKYGGSVFQECKRDVQTALEELSFRQDRVQPFWNKTRGGMKAFLTPNSKDNGKESLAKTQNRRSSFASSYQHKSLPKTRNILKKRMSLTASMKSVIHHAQNKNSPTASMKQRELSADLSPCVVFIALVDILQVWNVDKKLENAVKTKVIEPILHQNLHADISAIEPALYKDRFLDMVKSRVKAMEDVGDYYNSVIVKQWLNITAEDDNESMGNAVGNDNNDNNNLVLNNTSSQSVGKKIFKNVGSSKASKLLGSVKRFSDSRP